MAQGLAGGGFAYDLVIGEEYESDLATILRSTGNKVEVKADFRAADTGNLFVEYHQPSGHSGIATSKAEWWAFYVVGTHTWYLIQSFKLKKLCRKALKQGLTRKGGDNDNYEGVLLPLSWLNERT